MKLLSRTPEMQAQIKAALLEQVERSMSSTAGVDKINLSYDIAALCPILADAVKPIIYYAPSAWIKMHFFTQKYTHEVALHGLVKKLRTPGQYYIYDVMAYPQTVTSATVKATDEYDMWLQSHEDEVFNNIRMQYHSHVNMATNASGVDLSYYESLISDIQDFYIFIIGNKSGDLNHMVYDKVQNILFERADIMHGILDANSKLTISGWLEESNTFIQKPAVPVTPPYVSPAYGYDYKGGAREPYTVQGSAVVPASTIIGSGYHKPNTDYEFGYTDANNKYHPYGSEKSKAKPEKKMTAAEKKAQKKLDNEYLKKLRDQEDEDYLNRRGQIIQTGYVNDITGGKLND